MAGYASEPGIGLIVIDSLSKLADLEGIDDGGAAAKWSPLMSALTRIARDTRAGCLLIHHGNKAGGYRDSTAIGAGVDIIVEVEDGPSGDPTLRRFTPKGRVRVTPFSARLDGVRYAVADSELTLSERIWGFVSANPGASTNAVEGAVTGRATDVSREIDRLIERGLLVNRGTKRHKSLYVAGALEQARDTGTRIDFRPSPEVVPDMFRSAIREPVVSDVGTNGKHAEPRGNHDGTDSEPLSAPTGSRSVLPGSESGNRSSEIGSAEGLGRERIRL